MKRILAINVALAFLTPLPTAATELSQQQGQEIEEIAQSMPIESAIGQLLIVSPPGDWMNQFGNPLDQELLALNVGNLMTNSYHYYAAKTPDPAVSLPKVQFFHRQWKGMFRSAKLPPPIIFLDFESRRFRSIRHTLDAPPPSLSIGSTRNPNLANRIGIVIGSQLRLAGFDALLGPVIDIDGSPQGSAGTLIGNRVFGSEPETVTAMASHVMNGIRSAGILVFPKHFPGYGKVLGHPHEKPPEFVGSHDELQANLEPFRQLLPVSDGFVSAHMKIPLAMDDELSTFSPQLMTQVLRSTAEVELGRIRIAPLKARDDLVLISDDLSDMGLRKATGLTFGEIAVRAIEAGHDLLLFSHLDVPGLSPRSACETDRRMSGAPKSHPPCFSLQQLRETIAFVANWAQAEANEDLIRKSLQRILTTKMRMLNVTQPGIAASRILGDWDLPEVPRYELSRPPGMQDSAHAVARQVFEESFIHLNPERLLASRHPSRTILVSKGSTCRQFRAIQPDDGLKLIIRCVGKHGRRFEDDKAWLRDQASDQDRRIILVVTDKETADLSALVAGRASRLGPGSDAMVLIHTTPKILSASVLARLPTFGNFSAHTQAIRVAADFIRGRTTPRDRKRLTIDLGPGGQIYRAAASAITVPAAHGVEAYGRLLRTNEIDPTEFKQLQRLAGELKSENDRLRADATDLNKKLEEVNERQSATDSAAARQSGEIRELKKETALLEAYTLLVSLLLCIIGMILLGPVWGKLASELRDIDEVTVGKLMAIPVRALFAVPGRAFARTAVGIVILSAGAYTLIERSTLTGDEIASLLVPKSPDVASAPPEQQQR